MSEHANVSVPGDKEAIAMLMCKTSVIGYIAKIRWSTLVGSRVNESCDKHGESGYICMSKIYFTPGTLVNGTEGNCFLVDETNTRFSVTRGVRIFVQGIIDYIYFAKPFSINCSR